MSTMRYAIILRLAATSPVSMTEDTPHCFFCNELTTYPTNGTEGHAKDCLWALAYTEAAADEAAHPRPEGTYTAPEHGWVCFHCGEHFPSDFAGQRRARDHFGWRPNATPICVLVGEKDSKVSFSMVRRLRAVEHHRDELLDQLEDLRKEHL